MGLTSSRLSSSSDAGEGLPLYVHQRLPPNSRCFRLFFLEPRKEGERRHQAEDDLGGVLRGRITVANLDQCAAFDALSYCWKGSIESSSPIPQGKDWILINMENGETSRMAIEPSLSTALRYLRARDQRLPMFIDQLCIDQGNELQSLNEKSEQICLMGDIYRSCERVLSWLDVATLHTDSFFDWVSLISDNTFLKSMVLQPQRARATLRALIDKQSEFGDDEVLERDVNSMLALEGLWDHFPHQGCLEICLRQWFRRIWIVQEACLGNEMVLICGRRSCSVQELEMVAIFQLFGSTLDKKQARRTWTFFSSDRASHMRHEALMAAVLASRLLNQRAHTRKSHPGQHITGKGLVGTVLWCNVDIFDHGPWVRFGASNPRDYIYALKGLAPADDPVASHLIPDYTKPVDEVFTDYTRSIINPTIDTLLLSQPDNKNLQHLPSWVPDWSADLALPHGYKSGYIPIFCAGNAAGEKPTVHTDSPYHEVLEIEGVVLCEVEQVGHHTMEMPQQPRMNHPPETLRALPRSVFDFFREVRRFCVLASEKPGSASIPSTAELDVAVWTTTTGGHGFSLTKQGTLLGSDFESQPLLGRAWDLQLRMDVFPTIMRMRADGLALLEANRIAAMQRNKEGRITSFWKMRASLIYWVGRLKLEALHLYWCQKFFLTRPFMSKTAEDMLYYGIFGLKYEPLVGELQTALLRHIGRKCFISAAGHVGLGPRGSRPGDLVAVLLGATTPIILRPSQTASQRYSYVGEAYCHGFMHGKALADKKHEKRRFEIE
ncbi:Heterokaryon incompatibility protein [Paramyrothecium foliicola]|nr:Heterokaryon incompatibility protein [Paramyrothecium foliicola]